MISVIMPAYNAAETISMAIESVIGQKYEKWELIIVDDNSTDRTADIILKNANLDNRIKYFKNNENFGPSYSRNFAINVATGRYIAFLDSDDIWHPLKLEQQLNFMINNGYSITYTKYHRFCYSGSEKLVTKTIKIPLIMRYSDLLKNSGIAGCLTIMIDRVSHPNIFFPMIKSEDYALWLSVLRSNTIAYCLDQDLGEYRISAHSVSSNKLVMAMSVWHIYRNIENLNLFSSIWYFFNYAMNASFRSIIYRI